MRSCHLVAVVLLCLSFLDGCRTLQRNEPSQRASLATDSTAITAYHRGNGYTANIGFTLTNSMGRPMSRAGCGGPGWPDLEKRVDGRWVSAYDQVHITCRTIPDFSLEPGSQITAVLKFLAYEPGHNIYPMLLVDSIDGLYRLRWSFVEGREADAKGARRLDVVSNEFQMLLSRLPPSASSY